MFFDCGLAFFLFRNAVLSASILCLSEISNSSRTQELWYSPKVAGKSNVAGWSQGNFPRSQFLKVILCKLCDCPIIILQFRRGREETEWTEEQKRPAVVDKLLTLD